MLNFACAAGTECMFPCCAFPFVLCDEWHLMNSVARDGPASSVCRSFLLVDRSFT